MALDTAMYKDRLIELRHELTRELKSIGIHDPETPENWIAIPEGVDVGEADENVGADRVEEWEERVSTLALLETRWNNVNRAIKKIEAGTYGICEISGEEIEEARLDANPAARTCIEHKEEEIDLPL